MKQEASSGLKGFDCNRRLTPASAKAFYEAGFRFVCRYVPRLTLHDGDLTQTERGVIHAAGLGLMPVQHVLSDKSWAPTPELGERYGIAAAASAAVCRVAAGTTLWCDLEGVTPATPSTDVIQFCNRWARAVAGTGYQPGLYVGWHNLLTPVELYQLIFTRYWAAYNLDRDQYPGTRGVCMRQASAHATDIPVTLAWASSEIDINVVNVDALGGLPCIDAPEPAALLTET